jgi:hypothetical protein
VVEGLVGQDLELADLLATVSLPTMTFDPILNLESLVGIDTRFNQISGIQA